MPHHDAHDEATTTLEIEVSTPDSPSRVVVVRAAGEARTGEVLDAIGSELGLAEATGAVQARSLVSGDWLDRAHRWRASGVLRGERLLLSVGLTPEGRATTLRRWARMPSSDVEGRVAVRRPPRTVTPEPTDAVPVPTQRTVRSARRFPWGAVLLPLLLGALLVLVVRRWEIVLFALFTPVMALWNYVEERRARADEVKELGTTYDEAVRHATERVAERSADWAAWRRRHLPAPAEVLSFARTLDARLWERQPGDPDFLTLRLGTGTLTSRVQIKRDEWRAEQPLRPDLENARAVSGVPAGVDLARSGAMAVVDREGDLAGSIGWAMAQVTALHSPADVMVTALLADEELRDWFRWLPHLPSGHLEADPLATDRAAGAALLSALVAIGSARRAARRDSRPTLVTPVFVLFVDERVDVDPALLNRVIGMSDVGILTLWFGADARLAPTTVPALFTVSGDRGRLVGHRDGVDLTLTPERLSRADALDLATSLAPLRDAADARQVRRVPDRVALEDLVPDLASPSALTQRWRRAPADRLVATVGRTADGPLELDLGPDGSHVLVGGTTGSGKSELLQSLVAAIAACYPPDRVGFLLVDYKGGAAFKDAMHLPHCVGVVTDLDEHLTRRVLRALDAEIRRREELLAGAGVRDVAELRRSRPDVQLEELVIIVDEFAALAKEIPEFVEGVVDLAARGRSLGLRLVLATQRPAGVISDRIRANVGVRIALRMNDESDSVDVIDTREAAHIPRTLAGRAFQRIHRDLVEFQSAYVGGPVRPAGSAAIEIHPVGSLPASAAPAGGPTTLEALVQAVDRVMQVGSWGRPHVPWLPELPTFIAVGDLLDLQRPPPEGSTVLGEADLPERQRRQLVTFDLHAQRNLLVFGTSRSGKTTVLRTVAAGLLDSMTPSRVQLFCLDFAGGGLQVFADAPHCVAVAGPEDPGLVARVLHRLATTVDARRRALAETGGHDVAALVEPTSGLPAPRVVVLVDGYANVSSFLERLDGGRVLDTWERLIRDGATVGVHFLLTADRRAAVPNAITSVITTRLVLRLAERDEYAVLGVEGAAARSATLPPGRGFVHGSTEVQVAVWASPDPAVEQQALQQLVVRLSDRDGRAFRKIGRMPRTVDLDELPAPGETFLPVVAVGDREVAPVGVDLREGHLLVAGPPRSGRTTTLTTLGLASLRAAAPPAVTTFGHRRPGLTVSGAVSVDVGDQAAVEAALRQIEHHLSEGRPVLCLCDDADAYPDEVSMRLEALARAGRDLPVRIVAAVDNRAALRAYGGLIPELRKSKQALLLSPEIELDGDLVGVRLRPSLEAVAGPGRAFLAARGDFELVQVAVADLAR